MEKSLNDLLLEESHPLNSPLIIHYKELSSNPIKKPPQ